MNMPTDSTARVQPANTDSGTLCQHFVLVALATLSHVVVDNVRGFADLLKLQSNSREESSFRKKILEQWVCSAMIIRSKFSCPNVCHDQTLESPWLSFTDMAKWRATKWGHISTCEFIQRMQPARIGPLRRATRECLSAWTRLEFEPVGFGLLRKIAIHTCHM